MKAIFFPIIFLSACWTSCDRQPNAAEQNQWAVAAGRLIGAVHRVAGEPHTLDEILGKLEPDDIVAINSQRQLTPELVFAKKRSDWGLEYPFAWVDVGTDRNEETLFVTWEGRRHRMPAQKFKGMYRKYSSDVGTVRAEIALNRTPVQ